MATQLEGFKELERKLKELGSTVGGKTLRSAVMTASLPLVKAAREKAPEGKDPHKTYKGRLVAPGFGKRSIARKSGLSKDKTTAWVIIGVKPEAYYMTQFVELGTSKQPKQPWLEPALRSQREAMIARLKEQLAAKIEKAARKR